MPKLKKITHEEVTDLLTNPNPPLDDVQRVVNCLLSEIQEAQDEAAAEQRIAAFYKMKANAAKGE